MIPVVWGRRTVRRRLGYSADFCPICREITCVQVTRIGTVSHLYFIPLGAETLKSHEVECASCRTPFFLAGFSAAFFTPRAAEDPIGLLGQSRPAMLDHLLERMDAQDRAGRGESDPDERARLLAEPFVALNPWVDARWGTGTIPTVAGLAFVAAFFLIPLSIVLWCTPSSGKTTTVVITAVAVLALLLAVRGIAKGGRAWLQNQIHPRLASALSPLRPTPDEIRGVLATLRARDFVIARRLNARRLVADLCGPAAV